MTLLYGLQQSVDSSTLMRYLIPYLANMVLEYCWSDEESVQNFNNIDEYCLYCDIDEYCLYCDYEKTLCMDLVKSFVIGLSLPVVLPFYYVVKNISKTTIDKERYPIVAAFYFGSMNVASKIMGNYMG